MRVQKARAKRGSSSPFVLLPYVSGAWYRECFEGQCKQLGIQKENTAHVC